MGARFRYFTNYFAGRKLKSLLMLLIEALVAISLGAIFAFFFCRNVEMTEGSMEPEIAVEDNLLVNTLAYLLGRPKREDIIVFKANASENASLYVKRVIGLPGERIQIRDGQIIIDGVTYMEQRDLPGITYEGLAEEEIVLGSDEYFVLGDNRNNSADSRYSDIGNVKSSLIVGKVWFRITPYSRMGLIR